MQTASVEDIKKSINSNIVDSEEYSVFIRETLKIVSDSLSKSLGYYGSNTVLEDPTKEGDLSKDGFSILSKIRFDNSISNTVMRFVKTISYDLVKEVGDGSTSAVVTSFNLYDAINTSLQDSTSDLYGIPRKEIIDVLNVIAGKIEDEIKAVATPITSENFDIVKQIATVSNNNDKDTGQMIYDIYKKIGREGFIFLEEGSSKGDSYRIHDGVETNARIVDDVFINTANKIDCSFDKTNVLMVRGDISKSDIDWAHSIIPSFLSKTGHGLVIIADSFNSDFLGFIKSNILASRNKPNAADLKVSCIDYDTSRDDFEDLAIYLGGTVLDPLNRNDDYVDATNELTSFLRVLGGCKRFRGNAGSSVFVEGKGKRDEIDARINLLEDELERLSNINNMDAGNLKKYRLEKRIALLNGSIATMYIGGKTMLERSTRKYLIEDSIHACKSAIDHGYVSGGNLAVNKAIIRLYEKEAFSSEEKVLVKLVDEAHAKVFQTVLANVGAYSPEETKNMVENCIFNNKIYNLKTKEYEKDEDTTIINSAMTDILITRSAFSIIGLLVTSNQYIKLLV